MKKYLVLTLIICGILSKVIGQQPSHANQTIINDKIEKSALLYEYIYDLVGKGKSEVIWSEDFDGEIPVDWQMVDNNDFCTFQHTYDAPQGQFSGGVLPLQSTTSDNGFVIIDSDLCNSGNEGDYQYVDAFLQSPAINLSDHQNVVLSFEHAFRYLHSNDESPIQVLVSTDNENWVSYDVRNGVQSNHMSPNPVYQAINISEIAGEEESVWIRFHKSEVTHYYWMIDDVSLVAFAESDLIIENVNYGGYSNIPGGQQQPLDLSATIFNDGSINIDDVMVHVDINDRLFNESSSEALVGPGEKKEIFLEETFLPEYKGEYNMIFSFSYDLFDDELGMYVYEDSFWVTDSIYSRDDNSYTEGISADAGMPFIVGNRFDFTFPVEATSLGLVLHHQTDPGAIIKGVLYEIDGDDFINVAETSEYTVEEPDIPEDYTEDPVSVVLSFEGSIELEQDKSYIAAIEYIGVDDDAVIAGTTGITQPAGASFMFYDGEWHEETITPLIRLFLGNNQAEGNILLDYTTIDATCGVANGSAKVYPLTGTPPFSFEWNTQPVQNTQTATNLAEGTYEVTVTDYIGYEATVEVEIIDLGGVTPEVDYSINEPAGCGNSDGSIIIDPQDEYDYLWSTGYTGKDLEDISAGTYMVTITEQEDKCTLELLFYVDDSDAAEILSDITHVRCFGNSDGSIALSLDGEVDDPSYIWSTGETENTIENLKAGTYSVTVADSGCMRMDDFDVNEPDELLIEFDVTEPLCHGGNSGAIYSEVTGGTSPYNYYWNTGSGEEYITELFAGNYKLTVTDDNNCKETKTVELTDPDELIITVDTIIEPTGSENDGAIKIFVTGGAENSYSFKWNHGPTTQNVYDLPAGTYTVTVTDVAGCSVSKTFKIGEVWIDKLLSSDIISVYPNPADNYANIKFDGAVGDVEITVNNVFGKTVYKTSLNVGESNKTYMIDTSNMIPGLYLIMVRTDEGDLPLKLIIQ